MRLNLYSPVESFQIHHVAAIFTSPTSSVSEQVTELVGRRDLFVCVQHGCNQLQLFPH